MYPNPVINYLTLELDLKIHAIKVTDVSGIFVDMVWEEPMLDVSKLSSGLYFIEVYTDKGMFTEQFIKNEYIDNEGRLKIQCQFFANNLLVFIS